MARRSIIGASSRTRVSSSSSNRRRARARAPISPPPLARRLRSRRRAPREKNPRTFFFSLFSLHRARYLTRSYRLTIRARGRVVVVVVSSIRLSSRVACSSTAPRSISSRCLHLGRVDARTAMSGAVIHARYVLLRGRFGAPRESAMRVGGRGRRRSLSSCFAPTRRDADPPLPVGEITLFIGTGGARETSRGLRYRSSETRRRSAAAGRGEGERESANTR